MAGARSLEKCNIRKVAIRTLTGHGWALHPNPTPTMTTKLSSETTAAHRKKLLSRIAAAQKQTDSAKRTAKLTKLGFRQAKQKFKDAKHAARKLRKVVKTLKAELAGLAVRKPALKRPAARSAVKRRRPVPVAAPAPEPVVAPPAVFVTPPAAPAQ